SGVLRLEGAGYVSGVSWLLTDYLAFPAACQALLQRRGGNVFITRLPASRGAAEFAVRRCSAVDRCRSLPAVTIKKVGTSQLQRDASVLSHCTRALMSFLHGTPTFLMIPR